MPYATQATLEAEYGVNEIRRLSNIGGASGATTTNTVRVVAALARQQAMIDIYIVRYLPLTPPYPVALITIHGIMTRYDLDSLEPRQDVRLRYEDAIKILKDVQKGISSLGLDGNSLNPQQPTSSSVAIGLAGGVYTADALNGYTDGGMLQPRRGAGGRLRGY